MPGVAPIGTLADAKAAIDIVVEQGEGSPSDRDDYYYRTFVAIREELLMLQAANSDFAPAWPVADNPVLRRPPEPEDRCYVDAPDAVILLDFACAAYGLLLRSLVATFGRSERGAKAARSALLELAFELMHILGKAATALTRLPAGADEPKVHAGMTFTMLRGTEPLIPGEVEQVVIVERLRALARAAALLPMLGNGTADRLDSLASSFRITA